MTPVHCYRVSRYQPGIPHTATSTWTSMSDIESHFDDGVLTRQEYERVESLYVEAVRAFAEAAQVGELYVSDVLLGPAASPAANQVRDGAKIRLDEALDILRLELREEISCRLESGDDFYVHTGLDFYVYVGMRNSSDDIIPMIEALGLFVERDVPSPYMIG
jgi:hypothetical protein